MNNEKDNESVLIDVIIGNVILGVVVQGVVLVVSETIVFHSIGIWVGVAIGVSMFVHMKRSIEDALDIGEENATKYMIKKCVLRNVIIVSAFLALGYTQIGSMLTALIGVLGLKISVYLQPHIYKVRIYLQRNLRKGG